MNYTITNQCEKDYEQDVKQIKRVNDFSLETMYTDVIRDGNDWILSILLTMKKVTHYFIRENDLSHKLVIVYNYSSSPFLKISNLLFSPNIYKF